MNTQTSNSSSAHGTPVLVRADQNLIPPSLQSALTSPPKVNSKPLTVETLAGAALQASLELSASQAGAATVSTTTTTLTTTTLTTTTAITNTAQSAATDPLPILQLPPEQRFEVFRWAVRMHGRDSSLFSLAKASREARGSVIAFLTGDLEGRAFRTLLLKGEIPKWKANAEALAKNAEELRKTALHITLGQGGAAGSLTNLSLPESKVVKISAAGIGRERVLAEVPALLEQLSSSAQVALDLSGNDLTGQDLAQLLPSLERKPVVYQLSLDNNPLCQGDEVCAPLVKLFSYVGPTSHLYLSNVGLNDATATAVSDSLAKSPTLLHVDLRNNPLTTAGGLAIVKGIVFGTNVKAVRLQRSAFGKDEVVAIAAFRAHFAIEEQLQKASGRPYDPTEDRDPVEIIEVDGVRAAWFAFSALGEAFQKKFESNALAQRI